MGKAILGLCILLAAIIAINIVVITKGADIEAKRTLCRVYTENGIPNYIIANGAKYKLNINGEPIVGRARVNPWVYDKVVNKAGCITINTER